MKWIKSLVVVTVIVFAAGCVWASSLDLPGVSYDVKVDVNFTNDQDVSVLHMHLDVLPDTIELLVTGFEVAVNTANNQFIMYSYTKQNAIPSGPIMKLHYDSVVTNTTFTLDVLSATDINATSLLTIGSVTGEIKLYYTTQEVDATALNIIASGTSGIDENADGVIDPLDLQKVINGQQ